MIASEICVCANIEPIIRRLQQEQNYVCTGRDTGTFGRKRDNNARSFFCTLGAHEKLHSGPGGKPLGKHCLIWTRFSVGVIKPSGRGLSRWFRCFPVYLRQHRHPNWRPQVCLLTEGEKEPQRKTGKELSEAAEEVTCDARADPITTPNLPPMLTGRRVNSSLLPDSVSVC